jgi:hypothetical protein
MRSIDKMIDGWAAERPEAGKVFLVKLTPGEEVSFIRNGEFHVEVGASHMVNVTDVVHDRRCR